MVSRIIYTERNAVHTQLSGRRRSSSAEKSKGGRHQKFAPSSKCTSPPMSASTPQTFVQESTKSKSKDVHKTKKRKHADDHEEPGTEKKKKHKKSRVENEDSVLAGETLVKKSKKRLLSPLAPTGHLTPTSSSRVDVRASTPIIIDNEAPPIQTDDYTNAQLSPEPSPLDDSTPSPFHSVRLSLYLPLSAISLSPSTALSSLQAEHLSPLLLTYYVPAHGVVLAFTNTVLSSTRPSPSSSLDLNTSTSAPILAHCADDYGVSYTWLTTTFLVFRPTPGEKLSGWINVSSDGFVGLISYNYFQAGVAKNRIPRDWRWIGPGGDLAQARKRSKRKKIKIRSDSDDDVMDIDMDADKSQATQVPAEDWGEDDYDGTGYFVSDGGSRVKGTLHYRIVDADVVPGHDRDKWSIQIEGTLLSPEDEAALVEEERAQAEKLKVRGWSSAKGAGRSTDMPARDAAMMSGGLGAEDRRRTVSVSQTPVPSSARR